MNPFHIWLGLPKKSVNPNHYQLLGIKSSERDKKVIDLAARNRLSQLKDISPEPGHTDTLEKLKQRVIKAHGILADSTTRKEYDKKLRSKLESLRKPKESPSSVDATMSSKKIDELPHQSAHSVALTANKSPVQPQPNPPSEPNALADNSNPLSPPAGLPVSDPQTASRQQPTDMSGPSEIPMAVPLPPQVPNPAAKSGLSDAPESFSLANESARSVGVSVKPLKYRRKKRSYVVPIIGLVLCVVGIIALAYIVINMDKVGLVPNPDASPDSTETTTSAALESPTNVQPEIEPNHSAATNSSDSEKPDINSGASESIPNQSPPDVTIVTLDFAELVRIRMHLENARRSMYRREAQMAQNEIDNARSLFDRFESNQKLALDPTQQPIKQAAYAATKIKVLLEGFWEQVVGSAVQIPSGQPIQVGEREIGFVEGSDESVSLRIDGSNVTYEYRYLPAGIAMALAEQGPKEDVPTWRMQKAAFYAVHAHLDPKYQDRAMECATLASQDNHDSEPIASFVQFNPTSIGVPETKSDALSREEIKEMMPKALVRLGLSDFKRIRPDQAESAIETILEAGVKKNDAAQRAIAFEIAYKLAIKSGDVRRVVDVLDEYELWVKLDRQRKLNLAILTISQAKLDEKRTRFLLTQIVESAENISDKRLKQRIINNGKKAGQKHNELAMLVKRLDRL